MQMKLFKSITPPLSFEAVVRYCLRTGLLIPGWPHYNLDETSFTEREKEIFLELVNPGE